MFGLTGPDRTPLRNAQLASLLAFQAGVLNSVGFVAVAAYTSHMTGLTAIVADSLVLGFGELARLAVTAIVAFVLGAGTCALVFNWGRRRDLRGRYANVLVLEAMLILAFGVLAQDLHGSRRFIVIIAVLGFTMGLQNAIITKLSGAQIRTTHVTGMITDIGIELGKAAYVERAPGLAPVTADWRKLGVLLLLVGLFFAGGVVGAIGYLKIGFPTVVPLAALLLVLASPPVLTDLRASRRPAR
ncbi:YoaK family protein [Nocardioides sp. AE5]|uniref:YoaK family protein n=1 Tax=Nocardioides sp. AE5 TaxID=2962573 RepID=UPI002881E6FE|nr:YoaK family protein [Nocardioides sp. AE5]MDT0202121.1 YoaK family protein [Nocardioides sp. AE5]